jgi:hypothetical protein
MKNEELLKSTNNLSTDDLNLLREKFVGEYAKKKGWNKEQLSNNQMLEIVSQREYKNPGLLKS